MCGRITGVGRWIALVLVVLLAMPFAAAAQDGPRAWVQIEAQPTLGGAQERARAYAAAFPDVAGFRMASGWYAIVLGPYSPEGAARRLADLRADNLVPADSFAALGEVYRTPFWPVGVDPARAPLIDTVAGAALPAPVETLPLSPFGQDLSSADEDFVTLPEGAPQGVPEPVPEPAALPDETPAEARRAEAALGPEERRQVQAALAFFGHYDAAIDGAFGPGTRAAMEGWQIAATLEPTGILTTGQRAALLGDRARIEAELGLQDFTEPEAGIALQLPAALVAFDRYDPPFVLFAPRADSGIRLTLISQPGDEATLFGLYDLLQTLDDVPLTGPRARGDRSFTIEASDTRIASFATAELRGGLIKGYMLTWEPQAAALAGRTLQALKAGFRPVGQRALDPGLVQLDEGTRAGMLAGMEVRRPAFSRSGFYVSDRGEVVTTSEVVAGCARLTLDRDTEADVVLTDAGIGIAVLRPRAALAPSRVAGLNAAAARAGSEVAVAGYSYEDALPAPALTYGTLEAVTGLDGERDLRRLTIETLPGDAGGPVIDASGVVLGMLLPRAEGGARVLPAGVAFALSSDALRARLGVAGILPPPAAPDGALAPTDLAAAATRMTVLVSCWK